MIDRIDLASMSLDELATWRAGVGAGSPLDQVANAELSRRQTLLQEEATKAALDTAEYTQQNARYMLASVVVLTISAVVSACVTFAQWREAHNQLSYTVKPSVDFDTEDYSSMPPVGVAIENGGPGPAVIKSVTYYVDRKPVTDVSEAIQFGKLNSKPLVYFQFDEDDTLAAGGKEWLIRYQKQGKEDPKDVDKFTDFIDQNLGIEVRFCSVLGDCWTKCSTKGRC